jgi:hypothetical protein
LTEATPPLQAVPRIETGSMQPPPGPPKPGTCWGGTNPHAAPRRAGLERYAREV